MHRTIFDTPIVNTALPSMARSLGESPLHMHMVVVSYVLTVAALYGAFTGVFVGRASRLWRLSLRPAAAAGVAA